MIIGIDLSAIQGPHRMRGIGYTLINFINNLPRDAKREHDFVFYVLPKGRADLDDPISLLNLEGINYTLRTIKPFKKINKKLPGRLNLFVSVANALLEIYRLSRGVSANYPTHGLDVFLQTDQNMSFPHKWRLKKVLIVYDIIPYVLEWDYLWSYHTARRVKGYSRKAALRCAARRWLYRYKLGINISHANKLLAISETTKLDFEHTYKSSRGKIIVTPLGVPSHGVSPNKLAEIAKYEKTSWGYLPFPYELSMDEPFLLFVGGADKRRKLEDLVAVFNRLRAEGKNLKLVLAGDSMRGPETIATEEIQGALKQSSYLDHIVFMGFIDDATRDWLYSNALAFVFPSRYEGFGLPVLEAMSYSCPVICYRNAATVEVAGDAPLYADNPEDLYHAIRKVLENPKLTATHRNRGISQVKKYTWEKTAESIVDSL